MEESEFAQFHYMLSRLRISHGSIDIFMYRAATYSLVFPVHLFSGGPSRNFPLLPFSLSCATIHNG